MAAAKSDNLVFKIVILGEVGVGKTSLFYRLRDNEFRTQLDRRNADVVNSCTKLVTIGPYKASFAIWDTAGEERFRTLTLSYYRNAHVIILLYSVDNLSSFRFLPKWVDDANAYAPFGALKILVGNKSDLTSELSTTTVEDFTSIYSLDLWFTISAKTGENVDRMFSTIAERLVTDIEAKKEMPSYLSIKNDRVVLRSEDKTKKKCQC